jgi:NADH dehydrogenase (ubiquinone) Fe-S protein 1
LRVLPRTNEDINEEWLSDKSRFACDGLKRQRLTFPMMKDHNGELKPCDWEDAILTVAKVLDSTPGDRLAAVVGGLADAEVSFFSSFEPVLLYYFKFLEQTGMVLLFFHSLA